VRERAEGANICKIFCGATLRSLLLDIMSIIRSAVMAVCWLDRSGHHIQRSGLGLTRPNGRDATAEYLFYPCVFVVKHYMTEPY